MIQNLIDIRSYKELQVYGNELIFNKDNLIEEVSMMINSVGKSMVMTDQKIANRKNVIVMGDILADVNMVENVNYETLISIGFLNKPRDPKVDLEQYFEKYDVVIVNDGSFEEPIRILNEIFNLN